MSDDIGPNKSSDFASLARRISTWTTRGLLTLIVLVAGIGLGRQVLRWWAADARPAAPQTAHDALGDPSQPHTVEVAGHPWSFRRQSIVGDKAVAIERLRAACRESLETTGNAEPRPRRPPASDEEKRLLALLADAKPVELVAGRWRLYELHEGLPMAAGVTAQTPGRVLLWGLAFPSDARQWTLCVFRPKNQSVEGVGKGFDVPLPPGCCKTLSLRADDGGVITTFSGKTPPERCMAIYRDWANEKGWPPAVDFQRLGTAWHAKFVSPDRDGGSLEVRFAPDGHGGWTGILMTTPQAAR